MKKEKCKQNELENEQNRNKVLLKKKQTVQDKLKFYVEMYNRY